MVSRFLLLAFLGLLFLPRPVMAREDDKPPISISSPDTASTFAYGTIKQRSLVWNKKDQVLVVHVTFTDAEENLGQPNDDQHQFRLPGVKFDEAKGIFYAVSAKGEVIPVAHTRKALFLTVVEATPNAVVRIMHPRGVITVILEAISPNDPAMRPAADPDGTHRVPLDSVLQ